MPQEVYKVTLEYSGPDVDNGTMLIEDFIDAVDGFSSLYKSIAHHYNTEYNFNIRIVGIESGSVDIGIEIIDFIADHGVELGAFLTVSGIFINNVIKSIVNIKKHIKVGNYKVKQDDSSSGLSIVNEDNEEIKISEDELELLKEKKVNNSLSKLTKPLEQNKIESTSIQSMLDSEDSITIDIDYNEKQYFQRGEIRTTQEGSLTIHGKFNSLTKTTNNGRFILPEGRQVPYHLAMDDPHDYYRDFAYSGPVRIECEAHYIDGEIDHLDIFSIRREQIELDLNDSVTE